MPTGKHLIAGEWLAGDETFVSRPALGPASAYPAGSPDLVDRAVRAAEDAFGSYSAVSRVKRAAFLRRIAEEIDVRSAAITEIGTAETGLSEARLESERGRTTGQLRLFADHIEAGAYLDRRHDPALPGRAPLPRPELRMMQRPIGPVAVFGASNFPLAFSTAGGDTASALAAGCPVVVKGHEAHPRTGQIAAEAIHAAIEACGLHSGFFSFVHGGAPDVGQSLVQHPLIRAVGFTGSLRGGRALFDLCATRPDPIPFFGELGSVNPMFLFPAALQARGGEIARGWAASLTMGAGQFCTKPGIVVLVAGADADFFAQEAKEALTPAPAQIMLADGIAAAYRAGADRIGSEAGITALLSSRCEGRAAAPELFRVSADDWLASHVLGEEVFGPLGIIVTVRDVAQMMNLAQSMKGQLTCTLHVDAADMVVAKPFVQVLERKAGRLLANGFPTGVEVCDAMVHGGPYPASTNFGHTSVGTLAIRRWLRPVCYQALPQELLPDECD
ncbi:MAG TPA: aldehyde dehydrogenase (NADP(+)) [Devosiaceae bacterium]